MREQQSANGIFYSCYFAGVALVINATATGQLQENSKLLFLMELGVSAFMPAIYHRNKDRIIQQATLFARRACQKAGQIREAITPDHCPLLKTI